MGESVIKACLHFLNEEEGINDLNHTLLTLIPKVKESKEVTDYRPISLYNVLYKIIAKTIANRLKMFLQHIISVN